MKDYSEAASAASSVTGRDGYIAFQALLYAVARIQSLPEDRQERSTMVDICRLVRSMNYPLAPMLWSVEHHVGHKIDLWPVHGGNEPGGLYSDEELDRRDTVRAWIDDHAAMFQQTLALKDAPPSDVVKFMGDAADLDGESA